jgi:hypothetical protein
MPLESGAPRMRYATTPKDEAPKAHREQAGGHRQGQNNLPQGPVGRSNPVLLSVERVKISPLYAVFARRSLPKQSHSFCLSDIPIPNTTSRRVRPCGRFAVPVLWIFVHHQLDVITHRLPGEAVLGYQTKTE